MILFGGLTPAGSLLADTWTFDLTWTQHPFPGPAPSRSAAIAFDEVHRRVVLFDEQGATWSLTGSGWEVIATTGPSPRAAAAMTFSPELSAIVLYGGVTTTGMTQLRQDLWKLTDAGWIELKIVGERPIARQDSCFAQDPPLHALVLHAGTDAAGQRLDDTWLFQYRSEVPDEICDNQLDDDGDHRIDGSDPDCI
jgi:hypothetical protein